MPRKGMRTVFFRSNTTTVASPHASSPSLGARTQRFSSQVFSSQLYSFSDAMIDETLTTAEVMINKWNPTNTIFTNSHYLFQENHKGEAKEFIRCVQDLQRAMNFLIFEDPNSEKLAAAQNLMQIAMKRLEKEFYQILSTNRDHLDPESVSGRTSFSISISRSRSSRASFSDYENESENDDVLHEAGKSISRVEDESAVVMLDIKQIADCMISAGYGKECVKIYKIIRKSIVDEGLYRLGIVHIKSNKIQKMDWEVLEMKMKNWLDAVKIAVRTLFNGERILCDLVFANSDSMRESCFSEICKEGAIVLFGFPKKIAKSKKPVPDRVFRILDIYNTLSELRMEIESIFSFESTLSIRLRVDKSLTRLSDAVRSMISEFESGVQKDSSKSHIHGGAIHSLTRYVTNYLSLLADYSVSLSEIFAGTPLPVQTQIPESYFEIQKVEESPQTDISVRFAWLNLVLLCKIDMKVGSYKDVALSYLFLANNLQFVVNGVRTSNQRSILGENWISKHESKVKQYIANYEKFGWSKVLSTLPPEDPTAEMAPEEVKTRFKKFTSAFETTYRAQSSWIISDSKLRDEIEVSICKKIVPVYTQFFEKHRDMVENSQIKFTPDELTNYISGLFYERK